MDLQKGYLSVLKVLGQMKSTSLVDEIPEAYEVYVPMSRIGDDTRELRMGMIVGTWGQFYWNPKAVCDRIEKFLGLPAGDPFWLNWIKQRRALEKTIGSFFSDPSRMHEPAYVRIGCGRMCFANAIDRMFGLSMDPLNSSGEPINRVGACGDVKVRYGDIPMHFDLPLNGIRFRGATKEELFRQTLDREATYEGNHLTTEHTLFGCGFTTDPDKEHSEFMRSHMEAAETDKNGRLLFVDNFDIDIARYVPVPGGVEGFEYDVDKINWDFDKSDGLTTGIAVTSGVGLWSHIMIPGIVDELCGGVRVCD